MNEMTAFLLLTALRIVLPALALMGIGAYIDRRKLKGM